MGLGPIDGGSNPLGSISILPTRMLQWKPGNSGVDFHIEAYIMEESLFVPGILQMCAITQESPLDFAAIG
jgi:hypothetical protein